MNTSLLAEHPPHRLTSAGAATRHRAQIEALLARRARRALPRFFTQATTLALNSDAQPFSIPALTDLWLTTLVEPMVHGLQPEDERMLRGMLGDEMPARVHESVQTTLAAAQQEGFSAQATRRAVREVLRPSARPQRPALTAALTDLPAALDPYGMEWDAVMASFALRGSTAIAGQQMMRALRHSSHSMKRWVSHHDDRVRQTHEATDGMTVPLDQLFLVGSDFLLFPGDTNGSPGETYNCRCVLIGVS